MRTSKRKNLVLFGRTLWQICREGICAFWKESRDKSHESRGLREGSKQPLVQQTVFASIALALVLLTLPLFSFTRVHNAGTHVRTSTSARTQASLHAGTQAGVSSRAGTDARTSVASTLRTLLTPATATAAASDTLNFQARLASANGAIVPDGYYNIEFKLYTAATSTGSSQGSCTGDAACVWTETHYDSNGVTAGNDNRVRVVNGYVSVYLGSITSFPSTIPWDQQLYLTMNVAGSTQTATPTYDGEMTPRLKLTAVPYAMQSKRASELATSSGINNATLSIAPPTSGNQTFVIQDQGGAGTYHLLTQEGAGTSLAGSFIQNQNSAAQTANLWISGTAKVDTSITVGKATTQGAVNLHDGTGYQGTIKLAAQTGNYSFTIPVASANDTFCLQGLANCSGSGASNVGALDGGTANANGATISSGTLYLQSASASYAGLVNTTTQTFAGNKTFNGNIIMSASATITLAGGTTASRPASPTEGMLYYDISTHQLLQWNGTKWVGDRTTSTKIVAASDSTQARKDSADYVATGTNDQTIIATALGTLPSTGGTVHLLPGHYYFGASLVIPNNGAALTSDTVSSAEIERGFNGTSFANGALVMVSGDYVTVSNISFDGNNETYANSNNNAINKHADSVGMVVSNNDIWDIAGDAVSIGSVSTSDPKSNRVINNRINSIDGNGITSTEYDSDIIISGNQIGYIDGDGIAASGAISSNTVTNISGTGIKAGNGGVVIGNFVSNTGVGIGTNFSNDITISGNRIVENDYGISLIDATGVSVTGNTIASGGVGINIQAGTYSGGITITGNTLSSNAYEAVKIVNNTDSILINNNSIYADTTSSVIDVGSVDDVSITGNQIVNDGSGYMINIGAGADDTALSNNKLDGANAINNLGTDTIYSGQVNGAGNYVIQPAGTIELQKNTNITGNLGITGTITGTSSLTLGTSSSTNGTIVLRNSTNANTVTIQSFAQTSGSYTLSIPSLTGNADICTSLGNCAAGSGSNYYIQNQNSSAQTANYWINGTARIDTSLLTSTIDAVSGTLSIGTANANSISIGRTGYTTTIQGYTGVTLNAGTGTTQVCRNSSGMLSSCDATYLAPTASNFIQNQNSTPQSANFYISGSGHLNGSLLAEGNIWTTGSITMGSGPYVTLSQSVGDRLDLGIGDSLNITSGALQTGNTVRLDSNGALSNITNYTQTGGNFTVLQGSAVDASMINVSSAGNSITIGSISWQAQTGSEALGWNSLAASADGSKLFATRGWGYVYTSTDYGVTWSTTGSYNSWEKMASSADGTKLVGIARPGNYRHIYTSTDSGATWTDRFTDASDSLSAIASSADGTKLAAMVYGGSIYTSTDSGATWTEQTSAGSHAWGSITMSSDGTKLAAASNGYIYTSTDSGATWTEQTGAGSRWWRAIASSTDGTKLAATSYNGYIYTSTDSGATWTTQTAAGSRQWRSITSSADGTKLAAAVDGGYLYVSTNSGVTWAEQGSAGSRGWSSIVSSSDGTKIAAAANSSYIYTLNTLSSTTTTSIRGNIGVTLNATAGSTIVCLNAAGFLSVCDGSSGGSSGDYIQNQNSSAQTANYWIDGTARADTAILTPTVDTASAGTLNIGTTNATGITIGGTGVMTNIQGGIQNGGDYLQTAGDFAVGDMMAISSSSYNITMGKPSWIALENAGEASWRSTAMSSDGTKLIAGSNTTLYTSANSGATWTERASAGSHIWKGVASSADGTKLAAASTNCDVDVCGPGYIYTSTDSGATWTERTSAGSREWQSITSSADGTRLAAVAWGEYIYTSTDSGATWTEQTSATIQSWYSITSSADGTRLAAVSYDYNNYSSVYTSTDSGVTWTEQTGAYDIGWSDIASSADGTKLVAVTGEGRIYTSANAGVDWTVQYDVLDGIYNDYFVAMNNNGTKIAIADSGDYGYGGGYIYTSTDSGATWAEQTLAGLRSWRDIASNADGTILVGAMGGGYIYSNSHVGLDGATTIQGNLISDGAILANGVVHINTDSTAALQIKRDSDSSIIFNVDTITGTTSVERLQTNVIQSSPNGLMTIGEDAAAIYMGKEYGTVVVQGSLMNEGKYVQSGGSDFVVQGMINAENSTNTVTLGGNIAWTEYSSSGSHRWISVASSADGVKLVAATNDDYGLRSIYTSTDSGTTWTEHFSGTSYYWNAVTSSADGTKLAAVDGNGGSIYTSTDSGGTWVERTSAGSRSWQSITSNSDGTKLVATDGTYIYTSTDSGATWTEQTSAGSHGWRSIASSADGVKLAAVGVANSVYTSTDSGATWAEHSSISFGGSWNGKSVASSADGTKLAVATDGGRVYTSTDSGATWTTQTSIGYGSWRSIVSSADGAKLALVSSMERYIYTSTDSGVTWIQQGVAGARSWSSIATSSDGTKLAAVVSDGYIYTSNGQGATIAVKGTLQVTSDFNQGGNSNFTTGTGTISLNGNTILAAGKTITLTGGTTASRPASPTEGMLYYDTSTKQLLQYNGTKWVSDRTTSTKIVAASNSSQAAKDSADYVADGNGDQTEINAALTAAAGGKVYLSEGTYTINASISIPNNTTLVGSGAGTIITIPNAQNGSYGMITNTDTTTGANVTIRDLNIDGNKVNQTSGSMTGIYLDHMGSGSGTSAIAGATITEVTIANLYGGDGMYLTNSSNNAISGTTTQNNGARGIEFQSSSNNIITDSAAKGNGGHGIYLQYSPSNRLVNNIAQDNGGYGFYLFGADNNSLTGNISQQNDTGFGTIYYSSNNTFTGNTAQENDNAGIHLGSLSEDNTITGNTTRWNNIGINAYDTDNNVITSNIVNDNTTYGISLETSHGNLISANKLHGNGDTTTNNAIYLIGSDSNTITGNNITDSSATTTNYAINVSDATSDTNYLADNTLGGGSINDIGTGTIYGGQVNNSGNYVIQPAGTVELQKNTNITGTITGTSSLTLGTSSATNGTIVLKNSTNANTVTIQSLAQSGSYTLSIPILTNNDTICTVGLNNCGGTAGANTSLSNLTSTNIGTTALNSTSNNLNLTTTTSGNIVLNSAGTIELQDSTNVTGAIAATSTITGTTVNGTTGINTGASAGTQRIDASGNLVNIGNITTSGTAQIKQTLWGHSFVQNAPASTTYYKIATLPISSAGTYDHVQIEGVLGGFLSSTKTPFTVFFANRNGFDYLYDLKGSVNGVVRIVAYTEADGSVSIYAHHTAAAYSTITYNITQSLGATVYQNPAATTTAPTGTLAFDSSSATYPPRTIVDNAGDVGIGTSTMLGSATIKAAAKATYGTVAIQGNTSSGAANIAGMSFVDNGGTRTGFIGDASGVNSDISMISDSGDILLSSAGIIELQDATDILGTLTVGTGVGEAEITVSGGTTGSQRIDFASGGNTTWSAGAIGGGANPGFYIQRYNGGAYVDAPISISNTTGLVTVSNIQIGTVANQSINFRTGAINQGMEMGRTDAASYSYIDFHSGATATDYDARIGSSGGTGASGGAAMDIQAAQVNLGGTLSFQGGAYGNGKEIFNTSDSWLRINQTSAFSSGIYFGSNLVRTDGSIQVGASGSAFNVTSGGAVTAASTITSGGTMVSNNSFQALQKGSYQIYNNSLQKVLQLWTLSADDNTAWMQIGNQTSTYISFKNTNTCVIGNGTGTTSCTSDARKKNIIGTATGNLSKIMQLQPTYYTWKSEAANPQLRLGLIAQNVQTQFPEMVTDDGSGYLSLDYGALVSPLIGAVQEQQAQINTLNTTVASLQASNLANGGNINGNLSIAGSLTVGGTITVAQNATFSQNVTIAGELYTADIYVGGHLVTVGSAPQIAVGSALGSGQGGVGNPAGVLDGNDSAGTVSMTAGTQNVISGSLVHISFNKAFNGPYKVVVSAGNDNAADVRVYTTKTATGFDIVARDSLQAGKNYQFDYIVIGAQSP